MYIVGWDAYLSFGGERGVLVVASSSCTYGIIVWPFLNYSKPLCSCLGPCCDGFDALPPTRVPVLFGEPSGDWNTTLIIHWD